MSYVSKQTAGTGAPVTFETTPGTGDTRNMVHALTVTVTNAITGIAANVASGLASMATIISSLATIAANQGVPSGGAILGFAAFTSSPTQFSSKACTRGIVIQNLDTTNNLLVSRGTPGAADPDTYTIKPGGLSPFLPCTNANVFTIASSSGTVNGCYAGA